LNLRADGEVFSIDTYADLEKHYPGDSWDEEGSNAYGCVKQLYLLKQQYRHLKVLLSIGGWSMSNNFPAVAAAGDSRARFAQSAVKMMGDWGFDGIDVDWEYPKDETEASNFALLLRAVREELDDYAEQHAPEHHLTLSIAAPAGSSHYGKLDLATLSGIVDFFNLMAYDFAGSWDTISGHQSNLKSTDGTQFSGSQALADYLAAGVPASKLVLGMPLYGRSFENTDGIGHPFSGVGDGSWENGVWDFKALPRPGATETFDPDLVAAYSYDAVERELVSYDTEQVVREKVAYAKDLGIAGTMFWEASGDRSDEQSLVRTSFTALGSIDMSSNLLSYPNSRYKNIAGGMSAEA
jgi:chitinase